MSAESRERFAAAVRSGEVTLDLPCLLLAAEALPDELGSGPALDRLVARGLADLDILAASVPPDGAAHRRLRDALGGFGGDAGDHLRLESSLLPDVLHRRRGLPIMVSTVWTEVARRAGIDAYGVALPGHFVVGVGDPDTFDPDAVDGTRLLVDPAGGGVLLPFDRARDLVEDLGAVFRREQLRPAEPVAVLTRMLTNIRAWAATPERAATRLWAIDLSLLLPRHDVALHQERAVLLQARGDYLAASAAFERFAEAVATVSPDDAHLSLVRARQARAHLN